MTDRKDRSALRVGMLSIVAALCFTALFVHSTNRVLGAERSALFIRLGSADGLQRGDAVLHRGVAVGEVRAIEFEGDAVLVRVRLARAVPVSAGARADMVAADIFGRQSIVLRAGHPSGRALADGDTIGGTGPTPMTARIEALGERASSLLSDGMIEDVHGMLAGAGTAAASATTAATEIAQLAQGARHLLEDQRSALDDLTGAARGLLAGVDSALAPDDIATLRTGLTASATNLASATATLDTASDRLARILEGLESGHGSAGRMLADAELYDRAAGSLAALERLLDDVRQNPKRYITVRIF